MKIEMGYLKAAASRGIDLYLRHEAAIMRIVFFVLMALIQVDLITGIARHRAEGGVFPISYLYFYCHIAVLLFRYNKPRVPPMN